MLHPLHEHFVEDMPYTNGFLIYKMTIFTAEHSNQYSLSLEVCWKKLLCKQPFVCACTACIMSCTDMHNPNMAAGKDNTEKHESKN